MQLAMYGLYETTDLEIAQLGGNCPAQSQWHPGTCCDWISSRETWRAALEEGPDLNHTKADNACLSVVTFACRRIDERSSGGSVVVQ